MADGLLEAVRGLRLAEPELGPKPPLAKLREHRPAQPDWVDIQAWFALYLESFRALLPAFWDDLALVSGWVLIY